MACKLQLKLTACLLFAFGLACFVYTTISVEDYLSYNSTNEIVVDRKNIYTYHLDFGQCQCKSLDNYQTCQKIEEYISHFTPPNQPSIPTDCLIGVCRMSNKLKICSIDQSPIYRAWFNLTYYDDIRNTKIYHTFHIDFNHRDDANKIIINYPQIRNIWYSKNSQDFLYHLSFPWVITSLTIGLLGSGIIIIICYFLI